MKPDKLLVWAAAGAAMLALPACGKIFPFGERLLPASYGPPFGDEVQRNLPKHPHYPAGEERHALADGGTAQSYRDHAACHAALRAAVSAHGPHGSVVRISAIETMGMYEADGAVHEHRCNDYKLTHRSWCKATGDGAHGEGHKIAAPGKDSPCKHSEAAH